MSKKIKIPKISDKKLKKLTQAAQFAYGNQTADEFFDDMLRHLPHARKVLAKRDQQGRVE